MAEKFQSAPGHMDPADHELTALQLISGTFEHSNTAKQLVLLLCGHLDPHRLAW